MLLLKMMEDGGMKPEENQMALITSVRLCGSILNAQIVPRLRGSLTTTARGLSTTRRLRNENETETEKTEEQPAVDRGNKTSLRGLPYNVVDPETSMRYVQSDAYKQTYGEEPVWLHYRRNFKGRFPKPVRKMCIRAGLYATGNPCPICRDDHLVPYYQNVKLLNQFISPYSGQVLDTMQTNICKKQHQNILVAVEQAWDYGLIDMPFVKRDYDYKDYYGDLVKDDTKEADKKTS